MTYYQASRGRTQVLTEALRRPYAKDPLVFEPKGTVHAVSADFPSRTLCHIDTVELRAFPDRAFEPVDHDDVDCCPQCLAVLT